MFFTKLARIVAIVGLLFGFLLLVLGIAGATAVIDEAAQARYGGTGRMIDRGVFTILIGLVLGTLAEISFSIRQAKQ
jgi:hypothetical protein